MQVDTQMVIETFCRNKTLIKHSSLVFLRAGQITTLGYPMIRSELYQYLDKQPCRLK